MTKNTVFLCTCFWLMVASWLPATAHRAPIVITTIEMIDAQTYGITHKLHAHDAISILAIDPDVTQPEIETLKSKAKVALYIDAHFDISVRSETGEHLSVAEEIIGAEIEGDYLFVYQQITAQNELQDLSIKSTILSDILDGWLNHVNIETNDQTYSLTFSESPKWQKVVN